LPVFGPAAILSDILKEEMHFGNNPGIESDFAGVIGGHPLTIFGDFLFSLLVIAGERIVRLFLAGRSLSVLRGTGFKRNTQIL